MAVAASAVHVLLMGILALMEVVMSAVLMVVLVNRLPVRVYWVVLASAVQLLLMVILALMEVVMYAQVTLLKVHVDAFRVALARLNLLPVIPIVQ
tara:strand:- start:1840 stop:2124 length:285 start_codon:yes stop_codon:yes gene_type:complete